MDIYVLAHNKMGQTGESLLKLIQNTSLSTIDLLVRESIQNSLDAAKPDNGRCITVDFLTGSCQRQELDGIFTNITEALKTKYPDTEEADYIAIRDSGTVGLTGPLREADVQHEKGFGNLRKLIYEICQAQPEEGKGGSWGLGKTVYFRVGIGIVLYYSRVQLEDGSYASRMAAALIEDNSKTDSLLRMSEQKNGNLFCGVAWWGKADKDFDDTMPITDEDEIGQILDIFDIPPYRDDETGTTVIIPYVDRKKLHDNANMQSFEVFERYSLEEMINLSVQRWYAPRLYNSSYKYGPFLDYRCNGSKLRGADRVKFFDIMRELYNEAENGEKIALRSEFVDETCAGHLCWRIVSSKELEMLSPHNAPSPIDFLLKTSKDEMEQSNPPILAYCRKVGMIVNYELRGEWVSSIQPTREDEFLLAFFVLNSNNNMRDNPELSLDEYIRQGEKADHMSWQDHVVKGVKYKVVSKLHKNVSRKLKEVVAPETTTSEKRNDSALQRLMGAFFLPAQNFGRLADARSNSGISSGSAGTSPNRKLPGLNDVRINYLSEDEIDITWTVVLKKKQKKITHEILAHASAILHAKDWEDDKAGIGLPFPFSIEMVEAFYKKEPLECKTITSAKNIIYGFEIDTSDVRVVKKEKNEIYCHMKVYCKDNSIPCSLSIKEAAE